ncbi:MAG: DNA recombination protein RmuC [Pseudomonadota bacterium]|nr:DNA recombination protein RmuC [Desulfobacteraceae bacterium]MBU0989221.1 DNA recombination protein RmuC [Pseudomonadota bacterium]
MEVVLSWVAPIFSAVAVVLLIILLRNASKDRTERVEQAIREEFRFSREESARAARDLREEVAAAQKASIETMIQTIAEMGKLQRNQLESVEKRIQGLTDSNEARMEKLRDTLDAQLKSLQEGNEKKLDQMRQTVDEKLQSTLEKRLGQSFKLVSERLEAVQRGLGEMQNLASGVGDLKRVLTNVKARGTWGEVQLGALLEQILTPAQYDKNVQTREGSREMVEYAIRLPGPDKDMRSSVWLPIDSKFPQEDYLRLASAADAADVDAVEKATAALTRSVQSSAKEIADKYLDPPRTTDFAIMFLPTEGLYAEVLRQPGLMEKIQQTFRVVVAGPTTLSAILSSLRMGFRTLAIEKRSSEVWKILAAVKTEFGKFGDVLTRVKKQLDTASNTIDQTNVRTKAMQRKLRTVEQLPLDASEKLLGLSEQRPTETMDGETRT